MGNGLFEKNMLILEKLTFTAAHLSFMIEQNFSKNQYNPEF